MAQKKNKNKKQESNELDIPYARTKKRVVLDFPPTQTQSPVTYLLAKEYDIACNILKASIAPEESGKLIIEMDGYPDKLDEAIEKLKESGIQVTEIARKVSFDMDNCTHCGLCVSVCLAGALKLDGDYKLEFIEPKCTVCEMCVPACPVDVVNIDI